MSISEKLLQITENEQKVYDAGFARGQAQGGGGDADYQRGVTDGKKAEYDAFWDVFQENGNRVSYQSAFPRYGWTDANFSPKYDIVFGDGTYDADTAFDYNQIGDIDAILTRNGVTIDASRAIRINSTFRGCNSKSLPVIDLANCKSLMMSFYNMAKLQSLNIVNLRADCTFDRPLMYCYAMTDLTIGGTIGQNGFNLTGTTLLNHDSLMSVINALETKTSGTWTCTLAAGNLSKLTDAEKAIATEKGWTLA